MSFWQSFVSVFRLCEARCSSRDDVECSRLLTVKITYPTAVVKRIGYSINSFFSGSFSSVLSYDVHIECDEDIENDMEKPPFLDFEIEDIHIGDKIYIGVELRDGGLNAKSITVDSTSKQVLDLMVDERGEVETSGSLIPEQESRDNSPGVRHF